MGFNDFLTKIFGNKSQKDMREIKPWIDKIKAASPEIEQLDNDALRAKTQEIRRYVQDAAIEKRAKIDELKAKIEVTELEDREPIFTQIDKIEKEILDLFEEKLNEVLPQVFAIVKETAKRFSENEEIVVTATDFDRELAASHDFVRIEDDKAIYQNHWMAGGNEVTWNMVHYDVQLIGGVVLHQGKIAEMATGEGKTLVATLPVFLNALTGNGVHVVTVNDYLAKRDAEWMGPLYMFHGLSVDCIDKHQPNSIPRRNAYLADITFGTNNEFGFDYLRDNMAIRPQDLVQRKHNYAIVDEVDSVLIDDARTPLIISGPIPQNADTQLFEDFRPYVERLVAKQRDLATKYLAEARKLIYSEDKKEVEEGFLALYRSHKALPKNKPLIKFLSEQGIKTGMLATEEIYMEQNMRRMHEVTDPLYFVIDEKLKSVELTDKGFDELSSYTSEPSFFVLPDIVTQLAELENDKSLNDEDTIHYIAFGKGGWRWIRYAHSGLFDLDKKIRDYTPEELDLFLNSPQVRLKNPPHNWPKTAKYEGIIPRMYRSIINSEEGLLHASVLNPMLRMGTCPDCGGTRLNPTKLKCRIDGKNIAEVCAMPITRLNQWVYSIADPLAVDLKEAIGARLTALEEIGLGYLSLDRAVGTLSGGEAQRCKIAKYINSSLSDVLYILDEPSVGLHNHDIKLMKHSVQRLRDAGNTVLLVEHHKEMIRIADHIIDMGPGPGIDGGSIVFEGTYEGLLKSGTATGEMMKNRSCPQNLPRREGNGCVELKNAALHNLQHVSINLPLGCFCVVCGVAGSGKSSLMECVRQQVGVDKVVFISQKNIGVSLRSTPATYMDVAVDIRKLFAKKHKMKETDFAFNGKGACPVCGGKGIVVSEMAFMDNIETTCEACGGLRYNKEVLQHKVNDKNIAQVFDLSVRLASEFFHGTVIEEKLRPMMQVGLGYLHLNQALSTLSGGELQRLKMASYLGSKNQIFIIDEPTDGLHMKDVQRIIDLFRNMVSAGNTVYVIEHNTDVIRAADYAVELGPGAGEQGGRILFEGTPDEMLHCKDSVTAQYLFDSFSRELQ